MKFFQLVPSNLNLDFIGKFPYFLAFSILSIIFVGFLVLTRGFNFGIDFTGGTVVNVKFDKPMGAEQVRKLAADAGDRDASVVLADKNKLEYLITTRNIAESGQTNPFIEKLTSLTQGQMKIQSSDSVGPKVGSELRKAALLSLIYAILIITIYIWFRFDIRFAPGTTIAMVHDVIVASGFYLVTGKEFDLTGIAALLTIAGYSVNDTVVIYDRVREILKNSGDQMPLSQVINKAVNLTLSRTLLTSLVTFISVLPIIVFCSGAVKDFALAICIGIFVGTYSTIYIAAPFTIYIEKFMEKKESKKGRPMPARG